MRSYFLDAQAMHRAHPDTFDAPSDVELDAVDEGDCVKVCAQAERFWIRVNKVTPTGFDGEVWNHLTARHRLRLRDRVSVERRHVLAVDLMPVPDSES